MNPFKKIAKANVFATTKPASIFDSDKVREERREEKRAIARNDAAALSENAKKRKTMQSTLSFGGDIAGKSKDSGKMKKAVDLLESEKPLETDSVAASQVAEDAQDEEEVDDMLVCSGYLYDGC